MTFTLNREGTKLTAAVKGSLDTLTSPALEKELGPALEGMTELVVDLKDLEYISSAGLRILIGAARQLHAGGGKMSVVNTREDVLKIFSLTGLDTIFGMV